MREFTQQDIDILKEILMARRDVRGNSFTNQSIEKKVIDEILMAANFAPSVGFSQPWKFVLIYDSKKREHIYDEFIKENNKAKKIFKEKEELYSSLKLEGIKESYLNIAVLYEKPKKAVLGQTSQKRMGEYSVVCAIENMWLMARAYGIGLGWVSILKPKKVKKILNIGKEYKLVAYLTLGHVKTFFDKPELETIGWDTRRSLEEIQIV